MINHPKSVDKRVLERIREKGRGCVFTPADFLDLAGRNAVGQVIFRMVRAGTIRQLARGIYDYPRVHSRLGVLLPSTDSVASALSGREATRLQPTGGHAANLLGLSTQVPVKAVFLTDGRSRKVHLGQRVIVLKKTTARQMATAGRMSGTVIQALRWIGQSHVDAQVVSALRRKLSVRDKRQLLQDARYAPAWIGDVIRLVAREEVS
jgi:hypothetical protein